MSKQRKKYKAGISLTAVIILSAVLLATGISIVLTSIDLLKSANQASNYFSLKAYTNTCMEESVQRLKFNTDYIGSFSVTLPEGTCDASVSDDIMQGIKIIDLDSYVNDLSLTEQRKLDVSDYPFVEVD